MEMIELYIPSNLEQHKGSIAAIYELHHQLSGRLMIEDIDITKELISKSKELKEVKIVEYLKAL
ncbi:hypothetical protein [Jeotgalibaca porci]|jgi:hypothetical protein|uniref:hypothetical protein n=1 Tax=Jeotgalibaca porci TaxID=1868793 RepID=UPI0035A0FD54